MITGARRGLLQMSPRETANVTVTKPNWNVKENAMLLQA